MPGRPTRAFVSLSESKSETLGRKGRGGPSTHRTVGLLVILGRREGSGKLSGFLKALSKVGLVELESGEASAASEPAAREVDLDALSADISALEAQLDPDSSGAQGAAAPVQPVHMGDAVSGVDEGRPFEELYEQAGVKPSPFPAEKLLRLLDGLKAMDDKTRTAAVRAMDAADDAWSIEDPVLDAQRKIAALKNCTDELDQVVAAARQQAEADLKARDEYQREATATIRQQIAEMEAALEKELAQVAQERATIQAHLEAARQAGAREAARLMGEVERLTEILRIFGPQLIEPDATEG